MVDEVIETGPDALKKKRDELLLSIKTPEEPKLTSPDVMESVGETQRMNVLEREKKKGELEMKRAERESATARALSQKYESQYKDIPEFKPTPESKAELVGLFGLIGAIGAFGGGKSYGSALGAMNAMTGMMKGYQEGRKDLYEREKAAFDKNMQSIKAHNDQITAAFNRAKELAKTDLPTAERKLMTELKALDANVLATTLYKQGLMEADKARLEAYNKFNAQTAQSLRTVAALDKAIGGDETRQFVVVDGEQKYLTDPEIVQAQREGKSVSQAARPSAAGAKGLTPSAAERKSYVGLGNTITTAEKLLAKLDEPGFAEKIKKYRWQNLFAEEGGKIATQLMQSKIPDDVREFIQLGNALRNAYYLDTSGKAVTGGEAMRNYNVVPQPGDSPEVLRSKFKILIDKFNDDKADYREMYPQLPDLTKGSRPQAGSDEQRQAVQAFGSYEPDKYEYGINPATGKFARKPRAK